jgi:hypothetical protein
MKYIASWTLPYSTYREASARFLHGGGMPLPAVKLIGRWHGMSGVGFAVVECDDPKALFQWVAEWSDLFTVSVTPCLEDADAGAVLMAMKAQV